MEKEKRLIDADAIEMAMNERYMALVGEYGHYDHYNEGYCDALYAVENAPTVDAVEVVHGRWNSVEDIPHFVYSCSECGFRVGYGMMLHCNYCPNCGAKRDGDGE